MSVWTSANFVSGIDANRTLKDELMAALQRQRARRRISVTDLVNPRQAFFRRAHPEIQPAPERLQVMLAGTGFHELFGRATSTEEFVEQFVEYEGVVGKIDVYETTPVELKTTASMPRSALERRSYLDQLGMYCAMVRRQLACLVLYKRSLFGRPPLVRAFTVEYRDLSSIRTAMLARRDALLGAIETNDPSALPCCEWVAVGCDYRHCCGCETAPVGASLVDLGGMRVIENPLLCQWFLEKLSERPEMTRSFRLNDLVFPRKAALEHASGAEAAPQSPGDNMLVGMEREGFKGALLEALRFGAPGAFVRVPVGIRSLRAMVTTYRGVPTLVRATRFTTMVERHRLAETLTHYFDRLAFECALTGQGQGRLVLYYECIAGDKFMVYDVWFKDLAAITAEADLRLQLLEAGAPAAALPPCPAWMTKFCRFASHCGCGACVTSVPA